MQDYQSGTAGKPAIDPRGQFSEITPKLQRPESPPDDRPPRPQGRRKLRRRVLRLLVLLGVLLWCNGPGFRWFTHWVVSRYFAQAGATVRFNIQGTLTGGLVVDGFHLANYRSLEKLTVKRVVPNYALTEAVRGRIRGIEVDGLHADIRLGQRPERRAAGHFDLERFVQQLRQARGRVVPLEIVLKNSSLKMTRDGKPVVALAPSQLRHAAGAAAFELELGALTEASGRSWPAQSSNIIWQPETLTTKQLDPWPGVRVRDLVVQLPGSGLPTADAQVGIDDALFVLAAAPGLRSFTLDLREGQLHSDDVAKRFGWKLPATGTLTSLALGVDDLLPNPRAATGAARFLLDNVIIGDLAIPELSVDVELDGQRASLVAGGNMLDSVFSLVAEQPVARAGGRFEAGDIDGTFEFEEAAKVLSAVARRTPAMDPAAATVEATAAGSLHIGFDHWRPVKAEASMAVRPADPRVAAVVTLRGGWVPNGPLELALATDGLTSEVRFDPEARRYEGTAEFAGFASARIDRWLALVRGDTRGAVGLDGRWRGGGDLRKGTHHGALEQVVARWQRESVPALTVDGALDYDWPGSLTIRNLRVQTQDQVVTGEARLAEDWLELTDLRWQDRGVELAGGHAKLPVPANWTQWREVLGSDKRPLNIQLESKVVSLALLKDWLPAAARLDARSTGQVEVQVSGSYAEPVMDARVQLANLRSPEQPKLPPAGVVLLLEGRDGNLKLDGSVTAPDYPAAQLSAAMPFRPAVWAEQPPSILAEKVTARAQLPRIELARFSSLLAWAKSLNGSLSGNLAVTGELGKPVVTGKLDLTNGGLELKSERVPPISGVVASMDLAMDRINLTKLRATVAAGTLDASGSLTLAGGKPGEFNVRATGRHLPIVRNESLIVRANADLKLTGPWANATVSGTVGVVDSLFYRDVELLPIGTPFSAPAAAALPNLDTKAQPAENWPAPFRDWQLSGVVRTENPFLIRGNFATGKVVGSVRIGGTIAKPAPDGVLNISDVRASLPFSTLIVRKGTARFTPETGFDPELELRGTAQPRPYLVNVYIYGQASDPQLLLTSNPPLPENEIMTLLATGTTSTGLENPQAASTRALQLLVEELRRGRFGVGKRLRPLLKSLDRVEFSLAEEDPYSSQSYSSATLSITDRWLVSARMGGDGDSRVMAIWRLTFR